MSDVGKSLFDEDRKATKTIALINVMRDQLGLSPRKILVVGCGSGREAGILARQFGAETHGIDLVEEFEFDHEKSHPAVLSKMDARDLTFPDARFDFILSYHALEHIPRPELALAEMARVLVPDGAYVIGTPNKSRLVGYVGSARPLGQKIRFNLTDWGMRLSGRWSNEAGAHAGFSASELRTLCHDAFGSAQDVSDDYYRSLYGRRRKQIDMMTRTGAQAFVYPSVYVAGRKTPTR